MRQVKHACMKRMTASDESELALQCVKTHLFFTSKEYGAVMSRSAADDDVEIGVNRNVFPTMRAYTHFHDHYW